MMIKSKSSTVFLFASLVLLSCFANAEIILKPAGPSTFGTVAGTVGLTSETITEGTITAFVPGMTTSTEVATNGAFTLTVGANSSYSLYANLNLTDVPGINMSFTNLPAIAEGETRQLDLMRTSGRLLGRVTVIGGTLENLTLSASSSVTNGTVFESFSSSDSAVPINNQIPEVLLAMPSGITTDVSGNAQITTDLGCRIEESVPSQFITLSESSNVNPLIVEWTLDVSNTTCNPASLNGTFQINGLDPSAGLVTHQLDLDGPVTQGLSLTQFGPFQFDQLIEGNYRLLQQSSFTEPFGELTYPEVSIDVTGNSTYDAIHSVGITRGQVTLFGEWNYTNVTTAIVRLNGLTITTPTDFMSASDSIDLLTGNYDLVLGVGNWNLQNYLFNFEEDIGGVRKNQSVNVSLLPEEGVTRFTITEGQSLALPVAALETFTTELELLVEQQTGQPEVTIERLTLSGQAQLFDPLSEALRGTTTLFVARSGPQQNRFLITVYGLPGTYQMSARGTGSDGRQYSANFEMILGGNSPETPDPLACFGINKMKIHLDNDKHHDDDDDGRDKDDDSRDRNSDDENKGRNYTKIHIQKASFRLPEGIMVDLNQHNVSIDVDGITYEIPAGNFKQRGNKQHFGYKSANTEIPKIQARLDFDKAEWTFRVQGSDISTIDNSDGVDVTLTIGDYVGSENIVMHSKDRHGNKIKYKRKPKLYCRPGKEKKNKDDDDTDEDGDDKDDDANRDD